MNSVLLWIAGLLVVLLGSLFAVPYFIDWNSYRGVFEAEASRILGREVRIGRPLGFSRLPNEAKSASFAVPTGLLVYPQFAHLEHVEPRHTRQLVTGTNGYFGKVGRWLREGF